ncbi:MULTISPECIES: hypothetical protein [unclassified Rhizobium]|uniref:hypothetical protein n=1 Tax=unclassified Rhizobium TaxID=2613769 RepID=UPI001ADB3256|nr:MULTISPECIES: hypothetical protein [unclassified Rhizobium]MBO9125680.1 hypothetical protein [Rhizobium sp. 16-488-2b]MBO9176264.1 hypothetical protein [Rhizobium sp. 16-488-2a]
MHAEETTAVVQTVKYVLMSLFVLGFAGGFITNALILWRTQSTVSLPEEGDLPWGERKGRQFSRLTPFFIDSRFKRLRLVMTCSIGLSVWSFVLMLVVDGLSN